MANTLLGGRLRLRAAEFMHALLHDLVMAACPLMKKRLVTRLYSMIEARYDDYMDG
jgi:hypothetical protein